MDALSRERFGAPAPLTAEQEPPSVVRWRLPVRQKTATDQTWEQYRAAWLAATAAAEARLDEATRGGHEDSWWEDEVPDA